MESAKYNYEKPSSTNSKPMADFLNNLDIKKNGNEIEKHPAEQEHVEKPHPDESVHMHLSEEPEIQNHTTTISGRLST